MDGWMGGGREGEEERDEENRSFGTGVGPVGRAGGGGGDWTR